MEPLAPLPDPIAHASSVHGEGTRSSGGTSPRPMRGRCPAGIRWSDPATAS